MVPCLQIDKTWSAQAVRPYDPYLTPKGEEQVSQSMPESLPILILLKALDLKEEKPKILSNRLQLAAKLLSTVPAQCHQVSNLYSQQSEKTLNDMLLSCLSKGRKLHVGPK